MRHPHTPDTITRPPRPRCCAKCSTPGFGCARGLDCACHQKPKEATK